MFKYSQTDLQAICHNMRCCAGKKGYELLQKEAKGKDCDCQRENLKYLLRANQIICCYLPAGVINEGKSATCVITIPALTSITGQTITIDGVTYQDASSSANSNLAMGKLKTLINSTYPSTVNGNTISISSPVGDWNNKIVSIRIGQAPNIWTYQGWFQGGQYTNTEDDNCLSDDDATQILENIANICGCNCCEDVLTDSPNHL